MLFSLRQAKYVLMMMMFPILFFSVWLMVDYTGGENIIGAPKIRFFGALSKCLFFNIANAILDFSQLLSILLSFFQIWSIKNYRS